MGSGRGQCDICVCQREAAWLFLEVTRTAFRIRLSRRTFNLTIPTPQSPNPISWFNVGPVSGPTINQQRVFHTQEGNTGWVVRGIVSCLLFQRKQNVGDMQPLELNKCFRSHLLLSQHIENDSENGVLTLSSLNLA